MAASTTFLRHRWLQPEAVTLQTREADGNPSMISSTPEPDRVRAWLVGLCLYRFDDGLKQQLSSEFTAYATKPGYAAAVSWLIGLMLDIDDDPAAYPFSLSEKEFTFYSRQNFGDEIQNLEGVYHPPHFYDVLAKDVFGGLATIAVGVLAVSAFPEAAAGAAIVSRVAPQVARAAANTGAATVAAHFLGGDPFDARRKQALWPRYQLDYRRRQIP